MAMPQRDDAIEAIKRLEPPSRVRYGGPDALLEYAFMHGDEEEAERLREELPPSLLRATEDKYEIGGEGVARRWVRKVD